MKTTKQTKAELEHRLDDTQGALGFALASLSVQLLDAKRRSREYRHAAGEADAISMALSSLRCVFLRMLPENQRAVVIRARQITRIYLRPERRTRALLAA